jgi:NAD/NADP transhydrogenase beta subunit
MPEYARLVYLLTAVLFILGIKRLSSPATARNGNRLAAFGMLLAIVATLLFADILHPAWVAIGKTRRRAIVPKKTTAKPSHRIAIAMSNGHASSAYSLPPL